MNTESIYSTFYEDLKDDFLIYKKGRLWNLNFLSKKKIFLDAGEQNLQLNEQTEQLDNPNLYRYG